MRKLKLPEIFIFELTDLYDKKNIPKVIYCIHALSHMLASRGVAPNIKNLVGELQFTDAEIHATRQGLDAAGISMPSFGNIGSALAKELNGPEVAVAVAETIPEEPEEPEPVPVPTPEPEPETLLSNQELRDLFWANNTDSILKCQALFRSALDRKRFVERRKLHYDMEEFLIQVQAQGRGEIARRRFRDRMNHLYAFEPQIVT
ncbi:hypothetical protein BGZ52_010424, partial [Haplosporangium bisporale]